MSAVLVDCGHCDGTGLILKGEDCGARCVSCGGLGIRQHHLTEEQADELVFSNLPPGWRKEHARALVSRIKTGRPVVLPEVVWSPYEGT